MTPTHSFITPRTFPVDSDGLPDAISTQKVELGDGDSYDLTIAPVRKRIGDRWVRMLAYNGSVPGPNLRIPQGATVRVRVTNNGDAPTTVHWHGLRLDNRSDGTHATQASIPIGGAFTYELRVPDAGAYWYHPHIREDHGQEMGMYGTIVVTPRERDYWPAAHRERTLTLDDILIEDDRVAPFSTENITHVAMGRFGNIMLVDGETDLVLEAHRGEVVRLYLTNTANTRIFCVALPGARLKLVGGDSGRVEHERYVDDVLIAPSERVIVDASFDRAGQLELVHRTPERTYRLAQVRVDEESASLDSGVAFGTLRTNVELVEVRSSIAQYFRSAPDRTLAFVAEVEARAKPDHKHGHRGHAGRDHADAHGASASRDPSPRIEWEDDMLALNRASTPATTRWSIIDRATGKSNASIDWDFRLGARVKIRLVNEMQSDHPMPHPLHFHGAGRFLILARNGVVETNLVWKDTVLVTTGETVDILLEVTNPGKWMAHCHIAEHHEGGMMFGFDVARSSSSLAVPTFPAETHSGLVSASRAASGERFRAAPRKSLDLEKDAPVIAHAEAEVLAPAEIVFAVITDIAAWPNWNPDIRATSIDGPLEKGTNFRWKAGRVTITSTLEDVEPDHRIAWTGKTLGIRAVHVYDLLSHGDRTQVVTKESWDGAVARLFRSRLGQSLQKSLEAGLRHLKNEAERRVRDAS